MTDFLIITNNSHKNSPRAEQILYTLTSKGYDAEYLETPRTKNQLKIAKHLFNKVKEKRPLAIHILNVFDHLFLPLVSLKGKYYKYLIYDIRVLRGVRLESEYRNKLFRVFEIFERYIAKKADYITTANRLMAKKIESYIRVKNKPIIVLPNYPSKQFLDWNKQEVEMLKKHCRKVQKVILYVGRITNLEISLFFLVSIDQLKDQNIAFWFIGDGKKKLIDELKKRGNVTLFGWKNRKEISDFIKASDVCVIPRPETPATAYSNDEDTWKLNEYLVHNKVIVATGITISHEIPNLISGAPSDISRLLRLALTKKAYCCKPRFWEDFCEPKILQLYKSLEDN